MKLVLQASLASALLIFAPTLAYAEQTKSISSERAKASQSAEVAEDIKSTEHSLRFTSIAPRISSVVLDNSMTLLNQAKIELAAGKVETARALVLKAGLPFAEMDEKALAGKHPDELLKLHKMNQTLSSLIQGAEAVAVEEAAPTGFIAEARAALATSEGLMIAGETDRARELLFRSTETLKQQIVVLRSGDYFYIAAPKGDSFENWQDGLRRIEERRMISSYLMIEADSAGTDLNSLTQGVNQAEALVAYASQLAEKQQWGKALETLDLAYAKYEDSWRTIGIDW